MAFVGEAALSAFFEALFGKLGKLISSELELLTEEAVRKEIMNWKTTLTDIHAVLADAEGQAVKIWLAELQDAERQQLQSQVVKIWLAELQDLAYDVDDILDEFATKALERELMNESQASSSKAPKFTCCTGLRPSSIKSNYEMMSKIKDITGRLEDLATRKNTLSLSSVIPRDVGMPKTNPQRRPSSSVVNENNICGRRKNKEEICASLLRKDDTGASVYSVIPIVGLGGIGKTTLAQLVYNDESIKDHFDLRGWVCVSDKFDITEVTKTILESFTSEAQDITDLNSLQVKLKEKLSRKKFLLVLDDVWSRDYRHWSALRSPFDAGEPGSKIIVTTRDSEVSSIMTTAEDYKLQCLSDEDSLRMLARDALETEDFTRYPHLQEIGSELVKKCKGLPLAIKTIGGLLRTRVTRVAWEGILQSDIWTKPEERNGIIPALWLSFYYLPSQLKQCFAYCSLIPKDYEFDEEEIVLLWKAEGFLNAPNTGRKSEDLGSEYFQELVSRSFFQASSKDESMFVMHDLINDLAELVGGEKYFKRERHVEMKSPGRIRHSSYIMANFEEIKKFEIFFEAKFQSLRTFLPFQMGWRGKDVLFKDNFLLRKNVLHDLLSRLKCLRVFSLRRYQITEIPDSIGNLIHLRYLNFSYTEIKCLPDSICRLYNLETLLLRSCEKLEKLPSKIGNLVNLCHLDIAAAAAELIDMLLGHLPSTIKEMPSGIGNLTNLQALSNFIVGQGDALNIREMQNLSNLKGQLSISELQNVNHAQDAREAMLSSKPGLDNLVLEWSTDFDENLKEKEVQKEVLDLLRPHEELRELAIKRYAGIAFPNWIEDPSFKNLRSLKFEDCRNCLLLPAVGKLPLLKDLYIKGMNSVTSVDNEFYGENWPNVFPSLETLCFKDMPEWEEWKAREARKFPCLRDLCIRNCPNLIGTLPEYLPSLEKLEIDYCKKLVVSILNLPKLCALRIHGCQKVEVGSFVDLWSVKKISLYDVSNFACLTKERMKEESTKVEDLEVFSCNELVSFWQTKWGSLMSLKSLHTLKLLFCWQVVSMAVTEEDENAELLRLDLDIPSNIENLEIKYCEGLEKLSNMSHNFTCLRKLEIAKCPKLVSLLADNLPSTLESLVISKCNNLLCLLEVGKNINFSSTSLLEDLHIRKCKALKSLSSSNKLPMRLKWLNIDRCPELEFVAQEIGDNNCLKSIDIQFCENIQCLPQGMDKLEVLKLYECEKLEALPKLNSLQFQELLIVTCPRLTSIPEGGLPTTLTSVFLNDSNVVKAVMEWGLHRLTSLKELTIYGSDSVDVVSFPERGLPTTLTTLRISIPNVVKAVMEWGLHRLTSLTEFDILRVDYIDVVSLPERGLPTTLRTLCIDGPNVIKAVMESGLHSLTSLERLTISGTDCKHVVSFPQEEMKLPRSLKSIDISSFENLRKLSSKGFRYLSSLQSLWIQLCPKIESLPKKELLPSLLDLHIFKCPVLEKRCKRDKGYQSYIADIPSVSMTNHYL